MSYEIDGTTIETNETGFLKFTADWNAELAKIIANDEGIRELTKKHWDVISFVRVEYFGSQGFYPLVRTIKKAMARQWEEDVSHKDLKNLFPGSVSQQIFKISGLPAKS